MVSNTPVVVAAGGGDREGGGNLKVETTSKCRNNTSTSGLYSQDLFVQLQPVQHQQQREQPPQTIQQRPTPPSPVQISSMFSPEISTDAFAKLKKQLSPRRRQKQVTMEQQSQSPVRPPQQQSQQQQGAQTTALKTHRRRLSDNWRNLHVRTSSPSTNVPVAPVVESTDRAAVRNPVTNKKDNIIATTDAIPETIHDNSLTNTNNDDDAAAPLLNNIVPSITQPNNNNLATSQSNVPNSRLHIAPTATSNLLNNSTRSKKILVIDPETKQKYALNTDDHSLTDKELLVFHRGEGQNNGGGSDRASVANATVRNGYDSSGQFAGYHNNHDDQSIAHTLGTASALTEVDYGGRNYGRFRCHFPTSCHSVERMAFGHDIIVDGDEERIVDEEYTIDERTYNREYHQKYLVHERDGEEDMEEGVAEYTLGAANVHDDDRDEVDVGANRNGARDATSPTANKDDNTSPMLPNLVSAFGTLGGIGSLVSPRLTSPIATLKSFFPDNSDPTFSETLDEVRYSRILLIVFPSELGTSSAFGGTSVMSGYGTLLGMTFKQCPSDFMAHVSHVVRGSRSDMMGLRRGDVVSVSHCFALRLHTGMIVSILTLSFNNLAVRRRIEQHVRRREEHNPRRKAYQTPGVGGHAFLLSRAV